MLTAEINTVINSSLITLDVQVLDETFDMVYTSIGVLCWISDLKQWANIISRYLKPGGTLYLMESHPFMYVFDNEATGLNVRYPYFSQRKPFDWPGDCRNH